MPSEYCCLTDKALFGSIGHPFYCFCGASASYNVDDSDVKYWKDRDRMGKVQRKATKKDSGKTGINVCGKINRDIYLTGLRDG